MIDLNPDMTAGQLETSAYVYKTGKLSDEITDREIYEISVDSDGNYGNPSLLNLSVAQTAKDQYDSGMLVVNGLLYNISSDNLDAMDGRVLKCGEPQESTDAVPKAVVDTFFSKYAVLSNSFTTYEDKSTVADQCNFIKWGTFRLMDAFEYIGYGATKIASITLELHPYNKFNGVHDAYMAFYNYVGNDTEPVLSDFITKSKNKFDVSKITAQSGDNKKMKYEFDDLTLDAEKVYVFKFVNEDLSNRFVANSRMETEYDPCGSFTLVDSLDMKMHFAAIIGDTYIPDWSDATLTANPWKRLYIKEAEINNQVVPGSVQKTTAEGFKMEDISDGETYVVQISSNSTTGKPGFVFTKV